MYIGTVFLALALQGLATSKPVEKRGNADDYYVGKKWPTVPFEVPESWSGLMSIENASQNKSIHNELFFWYFHLEEGAKGNKDDLIIWLNGGPGCSSLEGLLQENGPVLFPFNITGQPDNPYVMRNPYSYTKLANTVWVENPVGTGFSRGTVDIKGYRDAAFEFFSFLKNFYDTFPENKNRRLFITGESDAGHMIPAIAEFIYDHEKESKEHGIYLKGISINDPTWTSDFLLTDAVAYPFVKRFEKELQDVGLDESFLKDFYANVSKHGYNKYYEKYLTYPPLPEAMPYIEDYSPWSKLYDQLAAKNPNLNVYNIKQSVVISDPLGYPPSSNIMSSKNILNDIPGFRELIHAPTDINWTSCSVGSVFATNGNTAYYPSETNLPGIIEKSEKTIIQHGENDLLLMMNGTALGIQNMTWAGVQGFQSKPDTPLVVNGTVQGKVHHERKLTLVEVFDSGHMIPQDQPPANFKALQYFVDLISFDDLSK